MTADRKHLTLLLAMALLLSVPTVAIAAASCQAVSPAQQVPVVELYTSEGCNSCPPADHWLSQLKGRPDVLAAAFHVDYWDRLGWKDRFADPRYTTRQAQSQAHSGATFSYTPQVLVNGKDWRRWPSLPAAVGAAAVQIHLQRDGDTSVQVRVLPQTSAPARLGLWWAWLEDDHSSAVKAGENSGVTLRHDHVVRAQGQRPAWSRDATEPWMLTLPAKERSGRQARLLVVVTDAASGLPLQAVQLTC